MPNIIFVNYKVENMFKFNFNLNLGTKNVEKSKVTILFWIKASKINPKERITVIQSKFKPYNKSYLYIKHIENFIDHERNAGPSYRWWTFGNIFMHKFDIKYLQAWLFNYYCLNSLSNPFSFWRISDEAIILYLKKIKS